MKLFHGSNVDIDSISLAMCRPYKDFGRGFYLTDIEEQAERMAVRVSRIYGGTPVVNSYEIEDDFRYIPDLRIKDFGVQTTEEWAKFVMNNRSRAFTDEKSDLCNKDNKYGTKSVQTDRLHQSSKQGNGFSHSLALDILILRVAVVSVNNFVIKGINNVAIWHFFIFN